MVSLQAVGIILVVAMLITPAATAQLVTVRFTRLMLVAALVGIASSIAGLYLSYWLDVAERRHDRPRPDRHVPASCSRSGRAGLLARRRHAADLAVDELAAEARA